MSWRRKAHVGAVVVTIALLAIIVSRVDLSKLVHAFEGVAWAWVGGVFALNLLNTWVEALRWRLILSSVKRETRTLNAFAALLVGVVGNTVLPLRLGDGARAYFLARREELSIASSLGSVMLDRIVDVTFFLIMMLLGGLLFPLPRLVARAGFVAAAGVGVAVAIFVILIVVRPHIEVRFGSKIGKGLAGQIHRFTVGLSSMKKAHILLPAGALSVISWGLRILMVVFMINAFHFDLPAVAAVVVLVFTNLGIAAVSTPANLGGFELWTLAAFTLFGIDTEHALSCAIVFHAVEVAPMVLLGLGALALTGMKSRDIISRAESGELTS